MKIILTLDDIDPALNDSNNINVQFLQFKKNGETEQTETPATQLADYLTMAIDHYFKSRDVVKVVVPGTINSNTNLH